MKVINAHKNVLDILNNKNKYKNTNDMMVDVINELKKLKLIKERKDKLNSLMPQ